jgi:N-methylhydantoinase A/oxoprolinase/acetone carboxylase beta subunit
MTDKYRVGIDIGGTFTDAVAVSPNGIRTAKVPSNSANPGAAVMMAVQALNLDTAPERFLHGTTLVTNMLLERKGAKTGFITNDGMRDILHIGRHERPLNYAIKQEIPQQHNPPVSRKWRLTVPERIDADGSLVVPLDEKSVRNAAKKLVKQGVEAIAVGFLHAYRYPQHEHQAETWIKEEAPDVFVCTSSEVSPRFREYERFLTTAWNARTAPGAARYLAILAEELEKTWPGLKLTLMTSNGGLEEASTDAIEKAGELRRTPIRLALSGPAAAGNAVAKVARDLHLQNCVGLDVGGTSSDIVVIRDGRLHEAPHEERQVGGYPLQVPMLDLHTIGAGGGSLTYRDEYGTLHVGPESAGARPGPACYNVGGTEPTVTDSAVAVGRLPGTTLLGGKMPIKAELAQEAIRDKFDVSDEGVLETALKVLTLAEANIAFAIRERTVARGLNPSELALIAAGGAGPLLSCGVADMLGLSEVVVPPRPGLLAAWGLLVAPDRRESTVTILKPLSQVTGKESETLFAQAYQNLAEKPPENASIIRTAALRYLGQGFEVEVIIEDPSDLIEIEKRFHDAHEHEYGFALWHSAVEWVELRVAWEIPAKTWSFPDSKNGHTPDFTEVEIWEARSLSDEDLRKEKCTARHFQRKDLRSGTVITGPVIIAEHDATTYIPTGWEATITDGGYIRIKKL